MKAKIMTPVEIVNEFVHSIADIISEYGEIAEKNMQETITMWVSGMDTHTEGGEN